MSDYVVTDTELTAVANAIRTKGGTSADLEWNADFISAIEAISGGGSEKQEYVGDFNPDSNAQGAKSGGWAFTTKSDGLKVKGLRFFARGTSCNVYISDTSGNAIVSKTNVTVTAGQWNDILLDEPITLSANTSYVVWGSHIDTYALKYKSGSVISPSLVAYVGTRYNTNFSTFPNNSESGNTYGVDIIALVKTATLITKNITENGTYSAEDDDADGYSEVTVDVEGGEGAKNILGGTAEPTSADGIDGDIYLQYINGELIDMSTYSNYVNTSMSVAQTENSAKFAYSSGDRVGAQVYKQVDLTNIDTITVDVSVGSGHYDITQQWMSPCIFIENTWNPANTWLGTTVNPDWNTQTPNSKATAEIDVSSLSGNYYIVMTGYGCNVEFSNLAYDDGSGDEAIKATYLKVNGSWQSLIGQDIDDVNTEGKDVDAIPDAYQKTDWIKTGSTFSCIYAYGYDMRVDDVIEFYAQADDWTQTSGGKAYYAIMGIKETLSSASGARGWIGVDNTLKKKIFSQFATLYGDNLEYSKSAGASAIDYDSVSDSNAKVLLKLSPQADAVPRGLFIGGYQNNEYATNTKIYKITVKRADGTLAMNLIPCYRKADSVVGVFDTITWRFITASNGTFTCGNDS